MYSTAGSGFPAGRRLEEHEAIVSGMHDGRGCTREEERTERGGRCRSDAWNNDRMLMAEQASGG